MSRIANSPCWVCILPVKSVIWLSAKSMMQLGGCELCRLHLHVDLRFSCMWRSISQVCRSHHREAYMSHGWLTITWQGVWLGYCCWVTPPLEICGLVLQINHLWILTAVPRVVQGCSLLAFVVSELADWDWMWDDVTYMILDTILCHFFFSFREFAKSHVHCGNIA